jgi:hypothetical protein
MSNDGPRETPTIRSVSKSADYSLAKPHDLRHSAREGMPDAGEGLSHNLLAQGTLRKRLFRIAEKACSQPLALRIGLSFRGCEPMSAPLFSLASNYLPARLTAGDSSLYRSA